MRFRTLLIILLFLPAISVFQGCLPPGPTVWAIEIWNKTSCDSVYCECDGFVNDNDVVISGIQPLHHRFVACIVEKRKYIKYTNIQDYITSDSAFVNLYKINENGDTCLVKRWTYLDDKDQGYSPFNLDTLQFSDEGGVDGRSEYYWGFNITDEMLEQDTISRAQAR